MRTGWTGWVVTNRARVVGGSFVAAWMVWYGVVAISLVVSANRMGNTVVLVMEVSQLLMVLLLLQIMLMKLVQLLLVQLLLVQLLLVQLLLLHLMMLELVMLELRLCKAPSMLLALDGCCPERLLLSSRSILPLFLRERC